MPSSSRPKARHGSSSTTSSASSSSASSSTSVDSYGYAAEPPRRPVASVKLLRCMRCAKMQEATSTDDVSTCGMVRIGEGIYYCQRCAKLVGYT